MLAIPAAWKAGTIANTGRRDVAGRVGGERVVGGGRVGGDPLARDVELDGVAGLADRVGVEAGVLCL